MSLGPVCLNQQIALVPLVIMIPLWLNIEGPQNSPARYHLERWQVTEISRVFAWDVAGYLPCQLYVLLRAPRACCRHGLCVCETRLLESLRFMTAQLGRCSFSEERVRPQRSRQGSCCLFHTFHFSSSSCFNLYCLTRSSRTFFRPSAFVFRAGTTSLTVLSTSTPLIMRKHLRSPGRGSKVSRTSLLNPISDER